MSRKRQQYISHLPHTHHRLPFNFVSGIIYVVSSIAAITLGVIFYNEYQRTPKQPREQLGSTLPPGVTVITRSDETSAPATNTIPPAAPPPATAEAPEETPINMPSVKPLLPRPWSGGYVERSKIRKAGIYPTADTCVMIDVNVTKERSNGGAATELPLKGNESLILSRYDIERIRGWTVGKVTWHGKLVRGQVRALGFSALTADWEEGLGTLRASATNGATLRWADFKTKLWREDHSPLTHLIRGNGQSRTAFSSLPKPVTDPGLWVSVPVDPIIVQALVAGAANSIAITDEKGQIGQPAVFASREDTNNCPYFEIEGGVVDVAVPGPVIRLKAYAHPALRRKTSVGALLTWLAPGDDGGYGQAFMYEVRYAPAPARFDGARKLPQYKTPWPQPSGQWDQVVVDNLEPDTMYTFFIRARDEAGQAGPVSEINLKTQPLLSYPKVPDPTLFPPAQLDVAPNKLNVRVIDETVGVDPISGRLRDQPPGAKKEQAGMSSLWDHSTRTIQLRASQNETVGFTLVLSQRGAVFPIPKFSVQDFQGPKTIIPGKQLRLSKTWYTQSTSQRTGFKWRGDALVSLETELPVKFPGNSVPGQTAKSVYAELHVPADAEPGIYRSQIIAGRNTDTESKLNIVLEVLPIRLPDRPRFTIELPVPFSIAVLYRKDLANLSDTLPIERMYQRMAHDHRCTLAFVPYARNGIYPRQAVPQISGQGVDLSVSSWKDWDQHFADYFSGAAFDGTDRGGVPVSHFILPVFENWPTPFADGYLCNNEETPNPAGLRVFAGLSDGIYSCLNSDYWRAFRAVLKQFADHFKALNVQGTMAHLWLNNGPSAGYRGKAPPWFLGNPLYRDDFLVLEAFAQVANAEVESFPGSRFAFRINVPDAAALAQYGLQRFTILSAGDRSSLAWQLLRERTTFTGESLWFQMGTLPMEDNTTEIVTLALRYFLKGADGWTLRDVVGQPEHLIGAQPQSLFYCGMPLEIEEPLPSLRLKALRRAQQDVEYLLLLQDRMKWTRAQLAEFVHQTVPGLEEGAAVRSDELYRLRYAVQELVKEP